MKKHCSYFAFQKLCWSPLAIIALSFFFIGSKASPSSDIDKIKFEPVIAAELRALDDPKGPIIFTYTKRQQQAAGQLEFYAEFKDAEGRIVATEDIVGHKLNLLEYKLNQLQTGTKVNVTSRDSHLVVRLIESSQKVKEKAFKKTPTMILPPQLIDYLTEHLEVLSRGESTEFTLLIPDLLQTVTFKAKQVANASTKIIRIELKAAYFYIALIAPKLYFEFDTETKKPISAEGPTLLLDKNKKQFKAMTRFILHSPETQNGVGNHLSTKPTSK